MNSVEKVKAICKERKIAIYRLEKDLGYANGYIGQLRKGTFPNDRLVEIANYLNVSTAYLTGEEQKEKPTTFTGDEFGEKDRQFLKWFHSLPQEKRQAILSLGGAPAELIEDLDR